MPTPLSLPVPPAAPAPSGTRACAHPARSAVAWAVACACAGWSGPGRAADAATGPTLRWAAPTPSRVAAATGATAANQAPATPAQSIRPTAVHAPAAAAASAPSASSAAAAAAPAAPAAPTRAAATDADDSVILEADRIRGTADADARAEGNVELRRPGLRLRADHLIFNSSTRTVQAEGRVRVESGGALTLGDTLTLNVDTQQGHFERPAFELPRLGSGGSAERLEFLGPDKLRALQARYTSCPRDGSGDPDWLLEARSVTLDAEGNEGIADGAVLRFIDVPILALPRMSFAVGTARKTGWLPPTVNLDNRGGFQLSVPWYWSIDEHRDLTLTPHLASRRGLGLDTEYRFLAPRASGLVGLDLWPDDRSRGEARHSLRWDLHANAQPWRADDPTRGLVARARGVRVSDNDWWKDFPNHTGSLTPRLLAQEASLDRFRPFASGWLHGYARFAHWQVLGAGISTPERIVAPYQRSPQLGLAWRSDSGPRWAGWDWSAQLEANRFVRATDDTATPTTPAGSGGQRLHLLMGASRRFAQGGWWVTPGAQLNAAAYRTDAGLSAARSVPTLSLDAGLQLERQAHFFGRTLRQTLEPRLHLTATPYVAQAHLPNYDSAGLDFNFASIYSDNAWSGIDRVSDTRQAILGLSTRLYEEDSGQEVARLAVVQRALLADERVVADSADRAAIAATPSQRWSDLLLLGSAALRDAWWLDGQMRIDSGGARLRRTVLSARYTPQPFHTLAATYRYTRDVSEQLELGWQWPLPAWGGKVSAAAGSGARAATHGCNGQLYGVGRVNYSLRDSRITDSLLGLEYDAGCWVGRVVAERLSTGRAEATVRLMLQLELIGLSRLGSNPLRTLKDNIPGYRLLREPRDPVPDVRVYE